MAKNENGIELPPMVGVNINRAMFEGNTTFLFILIADYLKANNLQVPAQISLIFRQQNLFEEE